MSYSVTPLGGIREIGKNFWIIDNGEHLLILDCGLKFPSDEMYGVNYLLPDIQYVVAEQERLAGIILTHAHEDHVGGLTALLEELDSPPPIIASELTIGLLEDRVTDVEEGFATLLETVQPRERRDIASFDVEFIHVCHSISGAMGLAVHTPEGAIVFTGDFKMDPTPIDQQPTDYYKFAQLGEEGVKLLISDSTNACCPGHTISEKEVAENFVNAFYRAKGRVIIATFSSSLHRIQQLLNRCQEFGRKVAFIGRSMERNTQKAHELGFLTYPDNLVITAEELANYSDEQITIITTGSQGEPNAALSRMAQKKYHAFSIKEGDTVIISSTPIPGNERSVINNINLLSELGAEVLYEKRKKGLHASGHASQEELKLMLNLTRPKHFIPTHGEYHQMKEHAALARATGMSSEDIFLLDIGDKLSLTAEGAEVTEQLPSGVLMVAGNGLGHMDSKALKERHKMVKKGVVFLSCTLDDDGYFVSTPRLVSKGFIIPEGSEDLYLEAAEQLSSEWRAYINKQKTPLERDDFAPRLSDRLNKILYLKTRRRPQIVPLVHYLGEEDVD